MATATYVNWQAVRLRVAGGLHTAVSNLPTRYDDIISEATRDAAADIKRIFVMKGYTVAQIAASDDIRVWNEMLGAFFSFVRLAGLTNYDLKAVEYLDCRKTMAEASAIIIDDVAIAPTGSDVGGVMYGDNTSGSIARTNWCRIGAGLTPRNRDGTYGCSGC